MVATKDILHWNGVYTVAKLYYAVQNKFINGSKLENLSDWFTRQHARYSSVAKPLLLHKGQKFKTKTVEEAAHKQQPEQPTDILNTADVNGETKHPAFPSGNSKVVYEKGDKSVSKSANLNLGKGDKSVSESANQTHGKGDNSVSESANQTHGKGDKSVSNRIVFVNDQTDDFVPKNDITNHEKGGKFVSKNTLPHHKKGDKSVSSKFAVLDNAKTDKCASQNNVLGQEKGDKSGSQKAEKGGNYWQRKVDDYKSRIKFRSSDSFDKTKAKNKSTSPKSKLQVEDRKEISEKEPQFKTKGKYKDINIQMKGKKDFAIDTVKNRIQNVYSQSDGKTGLFKKKNSVTESVSLKTKENTEKVHFESKEKSNFFYTLSEVKGKVQSISPQFIKTESVHVKDKKKVKVDSSQKVKGRLKTVEFDVKINQEKSSPKENNGNLKTRSAGSFSWKTKGKPKHMVSEHEPIAKKGQERTSLFDFITPQSEDSLSGKQNEILKKTIPEFKAYKRFKPVDKDKLRDKSKEISQMSFFNEQEIDEFSTPESVEDTGFVKQSTTDTKSEKTLNKKHKPKGEPITFTSSFNKLLDKIDEGIATDVDNEISAPADETLVAKEKEFNDDLLSYIEASIFSDRYFQKAYSTFKYYMRFKDISLKGSRYESHKIMDIRIYNALLHAWAKKGDMYRIQEMVSFMNENNVRPTLQTFAACLECLYRLKPQPKPEYIEPFAEQILEKIRKKGFDVREILNDCKFVKDERNSIIKVLKSVDEDFMPYPAIESTSYVGPLVEKLNDTLSDSEVVERNPYYGVECITKEKLKKQIIAQTNAENQDFVMIDSIAKIDHAQHEKVKERVKQFKERMKPSLRETFYNKVNKLEGKRPGQMNIVPFLKLFDPSVYVDFILLEVELLATESELYSPATSQLCFRLGNRIFERYKKEEKKKSGILNTICQVFKKYIDLYVDEDLHYKNHRLLWQELYNNYGKGADITVPEKKWSYFFIKSIGQFLMDIIIYDMHIETGLGSNEEHQGSNGKGYKRKRESKTPAFYTIYRHRGYSSQEEIKPHPDLIKLFDSTHRAQLPFQVWELPMLVPPVPWYTIHHGGYFNNLSRLIRLNDDKGKQIERMEKKPASEMHAVVDSLNVLAACPWIVNQKVLDIIIDVFNKKGNKNLDIPPPLSEAPPVPVVKKKLKPEEKSKVLKEKYRIKQTRSEMYSLWCSELYRLSIANAFRNEVFWFPHNMDFRGRTYPCPTHFNHLGNDVTRSLLLFAKGKPLGEKGLDWLKIHLVNLTGFKKRSSNTERLKYADDTMSDILDSADNAMEGRRWWQTSDEPWQTLACCIEIAQAVRSPDPKEYICHLPTHQDGSCNGLQHYAALGRDQAGAESVNLCQFDAPKDVYSDVAELVERERAKDAINGVKIAKTLEGYVARKVIKQTVMTTVYGVTRYGARRQILGQLQDLEDFPQEEAWAACEYLTDKTFFCLQEMFSSTKEIQDWFTLSAEVISRFCRKPVEWTTPLGLPVVQPYQKIIMNRRNSDFPANSFTRNERPNTVKQKNAFPPNYIHSLDSTHMMLTSLYCLRAGITFVSVHDCFWTHPCDIDVMNEICREQFVALHNQPLLEELSKHFIQMYGSSNSDLEPINKNQAFINAIIEKVPRRGNFDLQNVLKSTYFFS